MAFKFSVLVRNARLNAIETQIGTAAVLKVFSGTEPADCAAADPAGLLATLTLDADWMNAASGGTKAKLGTWSNAASGTGTAASWRLYASDGTTCGAQGNVTIMEGGGDMEVDNTSFVAAQTFTVTTFTLTDGNA
jgi:hypothetical protein